MLNKVQSSLILSFSDNKKSYYSLFLLILLYFFSRLLFLDADIPVWNVSSYCPIDELYYTSYAFQIFDGIDDRLRNVATSDYPNGFNIIEQCLTYLSLVIFGNNYYGLRLPSVIMGATSIIFLYSILKQRFGLLLSIFGILIFISNYGFSLASRIAEPTIFRMTFMLLVIYLLLIRSKLGKTSFLSEFILGFISGFSVFFVYPTNIFLIPAALCIYLFISATLYQKILNKSYMYFIYGILISFISYLLTTAYLFNFDFEFLKIFSPRIYTTFSTSSILEDLKNTFLSVLTEASFFKNDYFRWLFEFSLLFFLLNLTYCTIGYCVAKFKDHHSDNVISKFFNFKISNSAYRTDCIFFIFLFSFMSQTFFINDYPQRKLIILLPIVIYIVCSFINLVGFVFLQHYRKIQYIFLSTVVGGLCYISFSNAKESYEKIYKYPAYSYKKTMQSLQSYNDDLIIGGWSFGFRLYNSYHTAINKYVYWYTKKEVYNEHLKTLGKEFNNVKIIEYSDGKTKSDLIKLGFKLEKIILYSLDSSYPDVALYKTINQP